MKIERTPVQYVLTFDLNEGHAIVAALKYFADSHLEAVHSEKWLRWSAELETELKR